MELWVLTRQRLIEIDPLLPQNSLPILNVKARHPAQLLLAGIISAPLDENYPTLVLDGAVTL